MKEENLDKIARKFFAGSRKLWILFGIFIVISLVSVTSAISAEVNSTGGLGPVFKHMFFLLLGVVTAGAMAQLPPSWFRNKTLHYSALVGIMFFLLLFWGVEINGATRWLNIAGFSVQPSEFFKLCLILWGAIVYKLSGDYPEKSYRYFFAYWIISGIFIVFIGRENLSTAILMAGFVFVYSFILRAPWRLLGQGLLIGTIAVGIAGAVVYFAPKKTLAQITSRAPTWQNRLHSIGRNDENDPNKYKITDENFQEQMSQIAIARSNLRIHGPGSSKVRNTLPMAYSDFVYAIIIEEYGLLGLLLIPSLYVLWLYYAGQLARNERNRHRRALLLGIGLLIPMQAMINFAVVSGLVMTGQTLPLISYGGSSIIVCSMAMGIMLSISRVQNEIKELEREAEQLANSPDANE